MSRRKALPQVSKYVGSWRGEVVHNLEEKGTLITELLKRMCTYEEAVEYLLSAIYSPDVDDILGELLTWDLKLRERKRNRNEEE